MCKAAVAGGGLGQPSGNGQGSGNVCALGLLCIVGRCNKLLRKPCCLRRATRALQAVKVGEKAAELRAGGSCAVVEGIKPLATSLKRACISAAPNFTAARKAAADTGNGTQVIGRRTGAPHNETFCSA